MFFDACYLLRYQGHAFAKELAAKGLQTTVITDSAVFAMISRVNMVYMMISWDFLCFCYFNLIGIIFHLKVIVGAHAVMANGGIIAPVGLNMVSLAAKRHAVPFVVLAGVHKVLCCRALSRWFVLSLLLWRNFSNYIYFCCKMNQAFWLVFDHNARFDIRLCDY